MAKTKAKPINQLPTKTKLMLGLALKTKRG